MELALIDAIGPFFRGYHRRVINWSKIPFPHLVTTEGPERVAQWTAIREELTAFAGKVRALGYTAATLDDVAHLSTHAWLEPEVRARNSVLREEFRACMAVLRAAGLQVFITTDFLTTTPAVDARLRGRLDAAETWFGEVIAAFLDDFPEVEGVILRIGESDGRDVSDPLRSRLFLRTAGQVNRLLRTILPIFEKHGRKLIFRTWTVGAHLVGDLIWHRGRLAQALEGISSPAFILSMKHGESDFFRYLPLNRHFFRHDVPKIIELQARREYEGAGEYPSFIGWDVESYARELREAKNVIGFSVWCQTGGWHSFRRRAFIEPEALWIELNVAAAIRILRDGKTVEETVTEFFGPELAAGALELLRRADLVIRELLYLVEFATQKLFFRRVRIPPLLHVYWDSIFVYDAVRKVISHFVAQPEVALREGEAAFENFARMQALAHDLALPEEDIVFMRDTFELILLARRYYLLPPDPELDAQIRAAKRAYKKRWPRSHRQRYRIRTAAIAESRVGPRTVSWLARLLIRDQRGYRRVLDRVFTLHVLSWIYRLFHARHRKALPKFMRKSAMGVDSLVK